MRGAEMKDKEPKQQPKPETKPVEPKTENQQLQEYEEPAKPFRKLRE
jgi:hypothetical protein